MKQVIDWLRRSPRRCALLASMPQPLTAVQVARRTDWSLDACTYLFWELTERALLRCLNAGARRYRVYWLSEHGAASQRRLRGCLRLPRLPHSFPEVDWALYGEMCFSHRSTIIRTLSEPLQPAAIKRRAYRSNPALRMSANNARDAVKVLREHEVMETIHFDDERWVRVRLTPTGEKIRTLLLGADRFRLEGLGAAEAAIPSPPGTAAATGSAATGDRAPGRDADG